MKFLPHFSEQLDHQRGRIITHASQAVPGLDMVKQEHPCVDVGKFFLINLKLSPL